MTNIEKIAVRWISALAAGVTGVSAILVGADDIISRGVIIGVLAVSALLSGMAAFLTTETGQTALGLQARRTSKRG